MLKVPLNGFLYTFGISGKLMKNPKDNIQFIWKAFKEGKKWAFSEIYNSTYDDLYRFGIRYINDGEQIKDIIHDLYYKIWQNKANLSMPRNLKAYLLSSLRATIINHLKKNRRTPENLESSVEKFYFEPSIEADIISNESMDLNNKILYKELNNLSVTQKEAIYLHYLQDLDYKEIAEIMEISIQYARNLVHHGIKRLKEVRSKFNR